LALKIQVTITQMRNSTSTSGRRNAT
jgi:predicted ATP-dependent protease